MELITTTPTSTTPAAELVADRTDGLWTVADAAKFLRKSPRWLWSALTRRPEESGSVPHFRIGASPRFFPDDLAAWVRFGCPPAATFAEWQAAENKRQKRAG